MKLQLFARYCCVFWWAQAKLVLVGNIISIHSEQLQLQLLVLVLVLNLILIATFKVARYSYEKSLSSFLMLN